MTQPLQVLAIPRKVIVHVGPEVGPGAPPPPELHEEFLGDGLTYFDIRKKGTLEVVLNPWKNQVFTMPGPDEEADEARLAAALIERVKRMERIMRGTEDANEAEDGEAADIDGNSKEKEGEREREKGKEKDKEKERTEKDTARPESRAKRPAAAKADGTNKRQKASSSTSPPSSSLPASRLTSTYVSTRASTSSPTSARVSVSSTMSESMSKMATPSPTAKKHFSVQRVQQDTLMPVPVPIPVPVHPGDWTAGPSNPLAKRSKPPHKCRGSELAQIVPETERPRPHVPERLPSVRGLIHEVNALHVHQRRPLALPVPVPKTNMPPPPLPSSSSQLPQRLHQFIRRAPVVAEEPMVPVAPVQPDETQMLRERHLTYKDRLHGIDLRQHRHSRGPQLAAEKQRPLQQGPLQQGPPRQT
jgi:hypothetical protein